MSDLYESRLAQLRRTVPEALPQDAAAALASGALLIDIREPDEISAGVPRGSKWVPRGFLERDVAKLAPSPDTPIYVMCAGGIRSLFAAESLIGLGFKNVKSIRGGFGLWSARQLPIDVPHLLSSEQRLRYSRHLKIPEVGEEGQTKLLASRVLLVGAGALGSPAAFYLAAAGIGTIGIVDNDLVDRSNLQRQILHTDGRVGKKKVESARETLLALNPELECITFDERLSVDNAERIMSGFHLVLDGTDNFQTRYLINDACVKLGVPNVHGAVFRFEGYVTVFSPEQHAGCCYRCLYPSAPPPELAPSCADAGVLGVLPGVIGMLQAVEAVKLILGLGTPLVNRVLSYDALRADFSEYEVTRNAECPVCSQPRKAIRLEEVAAVCAA